MIRSIHFLSSVAFPPWWTGWLTRWRERLPETSPLTVKESADPALSALLLSGIHGRRDLITDGLSLAEGFVGIEAGQRRVVRFANRSNYADMKTGEVVLDGSLLVSTPFRPNASPEERLDILMGCAIHEALHLKYSSLAFCRLASVVSSK